MVEARAVLKAVISPAFIKARGAPCVSNSVSAPLGVVAEGGAVTVDADGAVYVFVEAADMDECSGVDVDSADRDDCADSKLDRYDEPEEGADELSANVTTLKPIPSLLEPGMKSVVEPSFRFTEILSG
jgi:hypothetical protein